eukprot:2663512-Rhodomonas_salina.1
MLLPGENWLYPPIVEVLPYAATPMLCAARCRHRISCYGMHRRAMCCCTALARTDLAHGATRCVILREHMVLRISYAMCGTELAYGAGRSYGASSGRETSSTALAYAATRCPVLSYAVLLRRV